MDAADTHRGKKQTRRCAPVERTVATDETIGSKQRTEQKQKQDWEQTAVEQAGAKTKSRLGAAGQGKDYQQDVTIRSQILIKLGKI